MVEGAQIIRLIANTYIKIPWCRRADREFYAYLARYQLIHKNCRFLFLDKLLIRINCHFEGEFAAVVRPKVVTALQYRIGKLVRAGVLEKSFDRDERWPAWTGRWADAGWDGDTTQPPPAAEYQYAVDGDYNPDQPVPSPVPSPVLLPAVEGDQDLYLNRQYSMVLGWKLTISRLDQP